MAIKQGDVIGYRGNVYIYLGDNLEFNFGPRYTGNATDAILNNSGIKHPNGRDLVLRIPQMNIGKFSDLQKELDHGTAKIYCNINDALVREDL